MLKNQTQPSNFWPALELLFASSLWGFGFIASIWALESLPPHFISTIRFLISGIFILTIFVLHRKWRKQISFSQFRLAFWPGVWLALTIATQTWGLKYTTATKSGFITTLYVLFVPIIEFLILKKRLHPLHFFYVGLALLGTLFICHFSLQELSVTWNKGDLLTFICALAASIQIFWFALISKRIESNMLFNGYQCLWGVPICLVFSFFSNESWLIASEAISLKSFIGLSILIFGSTLIAFAIQIRAQKFLSPATASMIFILESPFAMLFAFFVLNEQMSTQQIVGATLILASAFAAIRSGLKTDQETHQ